MLKHLFTIIRNNLRANLLLMAGMFVIGTALWYAVDYIYAVSVNQRKELGFQWEHVYYVQIGVVPQESSEWDDTPRDNWAITDEYVTLLERLKQHPAVANTCFTNMHFHYVWKSSSRMLSRDTISEYSMYRLVSPEYFDVFGVQGADGAPPAELSKRVKHNEMVLTEELAHYFVTGKSLADSPDKPQGMNLVGKYVSLNKKSDSLRVAAVCKRQKYNEYTSRLPAMYHVVTLGREADSYMGGYRSATQTDVFIRVKPEADGPDFMRDFRKKMRNHLRIGNFYLADMKPMSEVRDTQLADPRSDLYTFMAVAIFFLMNTFLAIFGTFWFRTQQRREELAVRLTFGATPSRLLLLLMGEGFLLLTFSYLPILPVAYYLGHTEVVSTYPTPWDFSRLFTSYGLTYLLLLGVAFLSIWFPARKAMSIQPVEALHGE
ncbi:MAG: ABC transporter permease [Bacteroides sp.]|nr:ABC transporter permease [Bacteroides sp.]